MYVHTYVLFVEKVSGKNIKAALIYIYIYIWQFLLIAVDNKIKG